MAKILIVDNASFMRNSLKFIVEKSGHEVIAVGGDGAEAIKLYKSHKPDIVTMDILMEGMDGIEALKEIMKDDPSAKVIMVTALGQENMQDEAKILGAAGYIRKPFKTEDITKEIERVMKGEK